MPFDPKFPDPWILEQADNIAEAPDDVRPGLRPLCFSVYYEDTLIRFPKCAVLVWPRCTTNEYNRPGIPDDPDELPDYVATWVGDLGLSGNPRLTQMMEEAGILEHPPAAALRDEVAFRVAGGVTPQTAQGQPWMLRHLYEGLHPFLGKEQTFDSMNDGDHFTQTAGLVAVHPILDYFWQFGAVVKTARARAYVSFGYDPDRYFNPVGHNPKGFIPNHPVGVMEQ